MYGAEAKSLFVKNTSKSSWHHFSKIWVVFYQKYEKWKPNEKLSIKCKHFGEGSYMFISISEIGHLTSYYLCMTWLNWHWSFILDYELVHTWSTHTSHKFNVQWMLISFVWLYVFKCDVYTQLLVDQTQKDFWVFFMFLKVFIYFVCLEFCPKCLFYSLSKNFSRGIFASKSRLSPSHENEGGKFQNTLNFR